MRIKVFSCLSVNFTKVIPMILVVALLMPSPVQAGDNNNGDALLAKCKSVFKIGKQGVVLDKSETNNLMNCLGYFNGFMGLYYNTVLQDNFKTTPFCIPQGANWKPLAKITVNFLEKHPELLHQPQESLTIMALSESFPCSKEASQ